MVSLTHAIGSRVPEHLLSLLCLDVALAFGSSRCSWRLSYNLYCLQRRGPKEWAGRNQDSGGADLHIRRHARCSLLSPAVEVSDQEGAL